MDTGLGIRNYSVMEQGKIDLILSNKPQDRRLLIEEVPDYRFPIHCARSVQRRHVQSSVRRIERDTALDQHPA